MLFIAEAEKMLLRTCFPVITRIIIEVMMNYQKKVFRVLLLFITLLFSFTSSLFAASIDGLVGEAFSDPVVKQDMDANWQKKTIIYETPDKDADLVITLNQNFYEFILPYVKKYADEYGLNIVVKRGTCGLSSGMLSQKTVDIGAFCCPPNKTDRLPGLQYHTVGIHPIAILVNPDNPIENITLRQLREIFKGDIISWNDLGWDSGKIFPIARLHCKKRPGHWRLILNNEDYFSVRTKIVGSISDVFSLVATMPTAIGYEVLWLSTRQAGNVKVLKVDGHNPDDFDKILTGAYPFYRALYLSTWEPDHVKNPHSQKLVNYIINMVEQHGEKQGIISVRRLKIAGWKFSGNELIGGPK